MSRRPVIGISIDVAPNPTDGRTRGKLTLNWNYAEVIAEAGGSPILLAPQSDVATVAHLIDGWLIPGGNDIDPGYWGEERHPQTSLIERERHEFERRLYGAVPPDLPILGICYGCQFLNVVEGGSLHQHLPDLVGHEDDQNGTLQTYRLDPARKTSEILGTPYPVGQSWHHQAIARVADPFVASGWNSDGTIEAIESETRPWTIGVQWHPERTPQSEESRSLFEHFVRAAAAYRANRR